MRIGNLLKSSVIEISVNQEVGASINKYQIGPDSPWITVDVKTFETGQENW